MKKINYFLKIPKSFIRKCRRLTKIFGFFPAVISLLQLIRRPFKPDSVVVSAYNSEIERNIYFRPTAGDISILEQIFTDRDYDYNFDFTPTFMIDGGAHCGFASLYFHHIFPEMKILAIEPAPKNFELLKKNIEGIKQISVLNKAIFSEFKKVALSNPNGRSPSYKFKETDNESGGYAETVPRLLEKFYDGRKGTILKLDIEGAEKEIFSQNTKEWINDFDVIFVEPHNRVFAGTEKAIYDAAKKNNKKVTKIGENIILKNKQ